MYAYKRKEPKTQKTVYGYTPERIEGIVKEFLDLELPLGEVDDVFVRLVTRWRRVVFQILENHEDHILLESQSWSGEVIKLMK
jgi:hypothetical protein